MILVQAIASFLPKITAPAPTDHDQLCLGIYKEENQTVTLVDVMIVPQINSSDKGPLDLVPYGLTIIGIVASSLGVKLSNLYTSARPRPLLLINLNSAGDGMEWQESGTDSAPLTVEILPATANVLAWSYTQCATVLIRCAISLVLQVALPIETGKPVGKDASSLAPVTFQTCLGAGVLSLHHQLQHQDLVFLAQHAGSSPGQVLLQGSSTGCLSDLLPKNYSSGVALTCKPLVRTSPPHMGVESVGFGGASPVAPLYTYMAAAGGQVQVASSTLQCDVLCYAPSSMLLSEVGPRVLRPALQQQVEAMARAMEAHGRVLQVSAHHFLPPGRNHHVTVLYPTLHPDADTNEMKLAPMRRHLHSLLGLPSNRPMLRVANALEEAALSCSTPTSGKQVPLLAARLVDVHKGLPSPPGNSGKAQLVDGSYEYCHYTQDRINDSGWGCAYRSLQTLVSWFRLQGFTQAAIPSHRQIQQILVQLEDKEPKFIGSSSWIGAVEIGYVLDSLLGVSCKILTVNRGSEIPGRARELAAHFATQGTPVMIGGGVLAYTLLGVQFDEATGDAAFLILDPHYTGDLAPKPEWEPKLWCCAHLPMLHLGDCDAGEDLRKIQQGTWVAWKRLGDNAAAGGPLFVPDAFYNFLCPQRPTDV